MPADFSLLDSPAISMNSFYPRKGWTSTPTGAEDLTIPVADGITLSGRFFPAGAGQPTILFFYGNGETCPDYDNIAPLYNRIDVNFLVADYRGYGRSDGWPSFNSMLSDSRSFLDFASALLADRGYAGPGLRYGPFHGPPLCLRALSQLRRPAEGRDNRKRPSHSGQLHPRA